MSKISIAITFIIFILWSTPAQAMHLADGILPLGWTGIWYLIVAPFVYWGLRDLQKKTGENPLTKPKVALVGAAVFVISCMPIPIPTLGVTSHACGIGIAVFLIGPHSTVVVTSIALLLQALFLAHGGLTTLGAGVFSMGVVGAYVAYASFVILQRLGLPGWCAAFAAGMLADWTTYSVTAMQLSLAISGDESILTTFGLVILALLPTQLPIGLLEGFLAAGVYVFVNKRRPELILEPLGREVAS